MLRNFSFTAKTSVKHLCASQHSFSFTFNLLKGSALRKMLLCCSTKSRNWERDLSSKSLWTITKIVSKFFSRKKMNGLNPFFFTACNVLMTEDRRLLTLTNSGKRRNCSLTAVLSPPNFKMVQFHIGPQTRYTNLESPVSSLKVNPNF